MWPRPSPSSAFAERRGRFLAAHAGPAAFVSGLRRKRNFPASHYPFRAESHFLYLVGQPLEAAVLVAAGGTVTLFAEPPPPDAALWSGPQPSLADLARLLELEVRPLEELPELPDLAVLPPQDAESADFFAHVLGREVTAAAGDEVQGRDAALAEAMIALRLVNDPAAVDQLRQASSVTELSHRRGMRATRAGVREATVRAAMEAAIIECGMTTAYGSIVTVHGEVLHDETHARTLGAKDLLLADVGAETPEGWAGDVTRTWPVSGRFSGSQRDLYEVVLAAQTAAIDAVAPGVRYREVHRVAGKKLVAGLVELGIYRGDPVDLAARGAAAPFFPHGVGHLLGLDVHDMEDLGDRAGYAPGRVRSDAPGDRYLRLDRDLQPGMAVTIEPGFYVIDGILRDPEVMGKLESALDRDVLARFADVRGIRIEDDVLVTETGCEVLTRAIPKLVKEVEAAVGGGSGA